MRTSHFKSKKMPWDRDLNEGVAQGAVLIRRAHAKAKRRDGSPVYQARTGRCPPTGTGHAEAEQNFHLILLYFALATAVRFLDRLCGVKS